MHQRAEQLILQQEYGLAAEYQNNSRAFRATLSNDIHQTVLAVKIVCRTRLEGLEWITEDGFFHAGPESLRGELSAMTGIGREIVSDNAR